jgi:hypothetical protein
MPFDSLVRDTVVDPLVRLGITPIPQETVTTYKREYRARLIQSNHQFFANRDLVRWKTAKRGQRSVAAFLNGPLAKIWSGPDDSPMPADLNHLAHQVRAEIPEAEFTVDYLSGDPILQVSYDFDGQRVKACLGIWEHAKTKMIAKQEGLASI